MLNRQLAVLVQVEGMAAGKINHAVLAQTNQLLIGGDGGRTGGKAQYRVGLGQNLAGNQHGSGLPHL